MLTTSIVNSARQPRAAPPALGDALALLKPVTWFPPMWAFLCGHVAAGAGAPAAAVAVTSAATHAGRQILVIVFTLVRLLGARPVVR